MGRLLRSLAGALLLMASVPAVASAQDAAQGRAVFQANCAVCHVTAANAHATIGPNLFAVVGRRAGAAAGFAYSPAMQHSGITWTSAQLLAYVQAPAHVVPGTRMPYAGLHNQQQAAALVAYLATLH